MIRFQRSLQASIGHFPEAASFAMEIAGYVKNKYGLNIQVFTDSEGYIYWTTDYPDYTAFGEIRSQIATDPEYWNLVASAEEHFLPGSLQDITMNPLG